MAQTAQLSPQNPWPGLRAFTEGDREFFFGRQRETSELFELVQRASVVVLYGQSGLGKTSLLQAGLLPDLKKVDFLPLRVRFDHGDDAPALAQQIKNELTAELDRTKSTTPRPAPDETLWEYFHRRDVDFWGPRNRLLTPVIVLDQFEEIFTLGQRSEKSAARVTQFAAELEAVLEHRAPQAVRNRLDANPDEAALYALDRQSVKFVISLREDFLPELDPWRARMPTLLANRFRLERMTGAQALDVVQCGGRDLLDSGAAHEVVDFVSKSKRERSSRAMEQRDVEPALLSVVCDELNRRRIDRGKSQITVDLLTDEREEIIQNFYDRAFDDIPTAVRDWVEDKLLTASGYRNRAALEDALKAGLPESAFDQLVNRRILHREERAGVVWLELTHDLLSDPASQSRAIREQRRATESARQREAELSAQLKNSRRQVAVFGTLLAVIVLLIVAGASLYLVTVRSRQVKLAEENARKSNSAMTKTLISQSSEIGGTWVQTQTLLQMIGDRKESFDKQSRQGISPEDLQKLDLAHVNFLTESSEALYDVGRFDDSMQDAQAALTLLNQGSWPDSSQNALKLMRAEALHNQAAGFRTTGQLSKSAESYNAALKLVPAASAKAMDPSFAHIYVLSQFGLGEVEFQSLALSSAATRFQAALDFANARGLDTDDVHWWRALAFEGLGLSQWDNNEAVKWYSKARDEVQWLKGKSKDPGNPQWKRLFADITYRWGFAADQLNQYDAAVNLYAESQADAEDLVTRDPDNRDWQLMLLQARRGIAQIHYDQGEEIEAQALLGQLEKGAKELNEAQPAWTRAAVLRSFLEMTLGDAQRAIVSNDSNTGLAQRKTAFDSASKFYDQSRDILLRTTKSAPEELDAVRLVSSVYWDEGDLRKVEGRSSRSAANQDKRLQAQADDQERGSLDFYNQALEILHPIEGIAKSSTEVISYKAGLQSAIGDVYRDLNQPQKAVSAYNESMVAREALATARPGPGNFGELSMIHVTLGDMYRAEKDSSKASSEYTLANTWVTKALQTPSQSTTYLANSAVVHSRFADIALDRNDLKTALDELDTAISTDWTALQSNYADPLLNSNMDKFRSELENLQKAIGPGTAANLSASASSKPGEAQNPDLTPEQAKYVERIQKLLDDKDPSSLLSQYGQAGAALRPLIHGAWRVLNGAEFSKARVQLLTVAKNVKVGQVQGIRKLPLDFYEGGGLYEAVVKTADGKDGVVDFVSSGERSILLDGSLEQIDAVNKNLPLKLDNPERASAYLHFWIGARQLVDDGRLELVDGADDLDWLPSATAEQRATIIGKATPLVLEAGANGTWNAIGSIELSGQLEQASFNLLRDGTFSFPREKQLESYLPIMVDAFEGGIRIRQSMEDLWQASIKSNPNDQTALTRLAAFYAEAGRWKDAIPAYKNLTAYLERQSKDNSSRAKNLQSAYFSLSVAQVFSQDFAGALATTDTWKKFAPDDLEEHRMRDHALLFLNRTQEAESAYLVDVGKKVGSTSWEKQIAADFKEFNDRNLKNPDFDHVNDLLDLERIQKVLKADATDADALHDLPMAYDRLKRYQEAVDAEKKWIAYVQRGSMKEPNRTTALTSAYLGLSWFQLLTRDFNGALASTEAGKKLDPSDLFLDTNRAHALLFLGQTQEAENIYLGNRGKKFDPKESEVWEQAILDDFNSFDKENLTNPEIPKIRQLLTPQSK